MTPRLPAVLDANGIIGLAKAGCLALTPDLFSPVYVPPSVVKEIADPQSAAQLNEALADWLSERTPAIDALQRVPALRSTADRDVLALAVEFSGSILITSDRRLASRATDLGVASVGAPATVQLMVEAGLLPAAKPVLDRMIAAGFGISEALYRNILKNLSE